MLVALLSTNPCNDATTNQQWESSYPQPTPLHLPLSKNHETERITLLNAWIQSAYVTTYEHLIMNHKQEGIQLECYTCSH